MNNNRRKFIKMAGIAAFGWSVCPSLAGASRYFMEEERLTAQQWAMAIDTRKLTGQIMDDCIEACHSIHNVPDIPPHQDIKWMWTEPYDNLFYDQSHPYLSDKEDKQFLTLCNHCENPPCVRVCPTKATFRRPDGIVLMDFHRCIGCRFCMAGCPFGARSFNFSDPRLHLETIDPEYPTRSMGVVEKCEFCSHLLDKGQMPACVVASQGALLFGDLNDPGSDVRRVLNTRYSLVRKPKLGTGPKVYYLI